MSHRDAEELAAEIAWMQDDASFRPKKDPLNDKGSHDLEARIERLEFRNDKLHKYVNKLMVENKQLREQLNKVVDEYRNKGTL
jgi:predicted RNase H-like nuclease (RuvC/YqgF family)